MGWSNCYEKEIIMKTYKELSRLESFEERFNYLALNSEVGMDTFGFNRYLNQGFYKSKEWKRLRNQIIIRDNGCDLGCEDRPIFGRIILHHINPITEDDIINSVDCLLDPENLICVSHDTHNAIHYGSLDLIKKDVVERTKGDTKLW